RAMSQDRLCSIADRLVAARRQGARVALLGPHPPADYEEGFAIQDMAVAALGSSVIGWKGMAGAHGPAVFAARLRLGSGAGRRYVGSSRAAARRHRTRDRLSPRLRYSAGRPI